MHIKYFLESIRGRDTLKDIPVSYMKIDPEKLNTNVWNRFNWLSDGLF
jgi:hypothetical protein